MLESEDITVFTQAALSAAAESVSSDPVVKSLRSFVENHEDRCTIRLTDECLVRWFLSRKGDLDKTKRAIGKFLTWRKQEGIDDAKAKDVLLSNADSKTAVVTEGACSAGRPCVFVYAKLHNKDGQSDSSMKQFLAYKIEEALRHGESIREAQAADEAAAELENTLGGGGGSEAVKAKAAALSSVATATASATATATATASASATYKNVDTFTLLFDLTGFGLSNMNYDAITSLVNLLTYQYPHVIERVVIINAPWLFNACWQLIQLVLSAEAAALVGFANSLEEIALYVPLDRLPPVVREHF